MLTSVYIIYGLALANAERVELERIDKRTIDVRLRKANIACALCVLLSFCFLFTRHCTSRDILGGLLPPFLNFRGVAAPAASPLPKPLMHSP